MENSNNISAIEWLVEQLEKQIEKSAKNELETNRGSDYRMGLRKAIDFCEQAKEMEKQQIIDAYKDGVNGTKLAEQYYNETFKNK